MVSRAMTVPHVGAMRGNLFLPADPEDVLCLPPGIRGLTFSHYWDSINGGVICRHCGLEIVMHDAALFGGRVGMQQKSLFYD